MRMTVSVPHMPSFDYLPSCLLVYNDTV